MANLVYTENRYTNKHFIAGFIAGSADKKANRPRSIHNAHPADYYFAGYDSAWDRNGQLVVEFIPE